MMDLPPYPLIHNEPIFFAHAPFSKPSFKGILTSKHGSSEAKIMAKTYNSGDSLVVTHLTTNPPVSCLNRAERTGSLVLKILWSYVVEGVNVYNITRVCFLVGDRGLGGMIFLHRIFDPRMEGSAKRNPFMFQKLCSFTQIILAITAASCFARV